MNLQFHPRGCRSRRARTQSGQIMAEAAIGLAVVTFVWMLLAFTSFMSVNHLRTILAARHAAWLKGEGGVEATQEQIEEWFFYQPGLCSVTYTPGAGVGGAAKLRETDPQGYFPTVGNPAIATVRFGVDSLDDDAASTFPFILLKSRVPFMPDAPSGPGFLNLESSCQWDETGDAWEGYGGLMSAAGWILTELKEVFGELASKLPF